MRSTATITLATLLFIGAAQHAAADLFVSDYNGGGFGQIRRFTDGGVPIPPTPLITLQQSGGGEGVACVTVNGAPVFFVASNSTTIDVYDQVTGAFVRTFVTVAGASFTALSVSQNGTLLYAAAGGGIYAFDTSTGATVYSTSASNVHDVVVGPDGGVYATHFQKPTGVLRYAADLSSSTTFVAYNNNGLTRAAGMAFDNSGNFYVSQFDGTGASFVNKYSVSGVVTTFAANIPYAAGSGVLGLARGPDGNIYSANLQAQTIGQITVPSNTLNPTFINAPAAGPLPKYVFFSTDCRVASSASIEICKASEPANPVTGNFTFTATNGSFTTPPVVLPVGVCSGPLPVPPGNVTVSEAATPGVGVSSITAYGFNPTTSAVENRLTSSDLTNRKGTVTVPSGGSATGTIVTFTNSKVPTGVIEVCKDAAPGASVTGNFSFDVTGAANNPYVIPAGACSGPIVVQAGSLTVTEIPRTGFVLSDAFTTPPDRLVSLNLPAAAAVVNVQAGDVSGETVIHFVNAPAANGQLKICKVAGPGVAQGQTFTITAGGVSYSVPAGPASQGGFCVVDGLFPIGTVVTVQETPPAPYQVLNMRVNPPDRAASAPILANGNGQVDVTVGSGFTEVIVTNIGTAPTGQLKICKIAGAGVALGTNFPFTVSNPSTRVQTYTVPAGPPSLNGYCVVDGTFPIGTHVTVAELPPFGFGVSGISLNGTAVTGGGSSVDVPIGKGLTEITFTNSRTGPIDNPTWVSAQLLTMVHYRLVGRSRDGEGRLHLTYRASVLNTGGAHDSVVAKLRAGGLDQALHFSAVEANSEKESDDTFTFVTEKDDVIDFSQLRWTWESSPARPNLGPAVR